VNQEQFQNVLERRIRLTQSVLGQKAKEYASDRDLLRSFKSGAEFLDITPQLYCLQLATKHLVSIRDMVLSSGEYTLAAWDEKIGDAINYLILLEGLVQENARLADNGG
jgi:hypothetical protein